jgi:hypothetical protein
MTLMPIPWATQSTKAQSGVVSCERLVNCYMEPSPSNSKSPFTIYGDAGLKLWTTIAETPIRGWLLFNGVHLFVAAGESLYVVTEDKVASKIGTVLGHGPVSTCANATHVCIATNLGLYAATTSLLVQVDSNFYTTATYQDGYGIFTLNDSEQFYISGLDDMTTVDPLDFTSADTFADKVRGGISDHRELIVFGYETIEHYYNSGDAYFPFTRTPGGFVETGCVAAGSIAKKSNLVFWLGNDGAVWAMSGAQPKRISTPGIERTIKGLPDHESAKAFCYSLEGHDNYALSFSSGTFVYDISTGLWRERESFGIDRWRAQDYVRAWELDLVADFETGDIYELDLSTYDENGSPLVRTIQAPPLHGGGRRVLMPRLFVDAEMGTSIDPNADPLFMLQWSDDGGKTWSNVHHGSAGKTGEYTKRFTWSRLGSFYQRTLRFSLSDSCKLAVLGAYAELEACSQ